jgi:mannose-6-phosphate isomerase-like protein (cupin superfamily)
MQTAIVDDSLFRQRYRFSRSGDVLRVEIWTDPGGGVLAEHVHPALEERYEILEGEVTFHLDGEARRADAGERLVVAPGVRHSFQNTGREPSQLVVEAEPALELRESIEDGAALMCAESFSESGAPRSLRALVEAAALAQRYCDTVVLSSPPAAIQRLLFPLLARFAAPRRSAGETSGGDAPATAA